MHHWRTSVAWVRRGFSPQYPFLPYHPLLKLKVDEYLLGKAQSTSTTDKEREEEKEDEDGKQKLKSTEKPPTFYYNGKSYAYHEIEMEQGTVCDISNEPRSIKIKYI